VLPAGAPPRLRGKGGWREHQRQAWNLASRMNQAQGRHPPVPHRHPRTVHQQRIGASPAHGQASAEDQRQFQSDHGAEDFARIRSYLQTAAKQNPNLLDVLAQLFTTGPWLPAGP